MRAELTPRFPRFLRLSFACLCAVLLASTTAAGQGSTTGTIRGTVQDSSGGILPGATVTVTNTGTKAMQTTVSDDRGQYLLARPVPGHLRPEGRALRVQDLRAEGHRRSARTTTAASTCGSTSASSRETVTVTAQPGSDPDARQARAKACITAKQIENLSVIGRSALELMRILPGVVTEFNQGESVSFGGGGNNTQGYTVNGIRSSSNTVSLDGSSPHRHRQQQRRHRLAEQRHGSGSQGAELELRGRVRHRRHERERRHRNPARRSSTARCTTTGAITASRPTTAPTASRAPRSRRAPISIRAATSAARSPSATATRRTATACSSSSPSKRQRQQVDSGSHFTRTLQPAR